MNSNQSAKTILCFGDSNTHGQMSESRDRWGVDVRWTSQLQSKLGDDYYVIEEGLNSRTTDLDYDKKPGRSGKEYLRPCLDTHNPLDMVIMMLGTNDLKIQYNRAVDEVAEAMRGLIKDIKTYAYKSSQDVIQPENVYVLSPIFIDTTKELFGELYAGQSYDEVSEEKSHQLAVAYNKIAIEEGVTFVDAAAVAVPGADGIHLDKESHDRLSSSLAEFIKEHL